MAYQIDRYNNTILTVIEDGTIDQTTDLKFIGKNYAGYGEIQNENFLFLLENFSGANPPPRALSGQVWFDSASNKLKFYDGNKWRTTGGSELAASEPTGLSEGDFWWDTANKQLYVFDGTDFILIGPQNAGAGVTAMVSQTVLDAANNPHAIISATLADEVIMILSPDEFTLNASNPSVGFDRIRKGLTLVNTTQATGGVTSTAHRWWGTAKSAEGMVLGGVFRPASDFVTTVNPVFTGQVQFPDAGVAIGDSLDLKIFIENDDEGVISNDVSPDSIIKFKTTTSAGTEKHIITIRESGVVPAADNSFELGSTSLRFSNVHSNLFTGIASQASKLYESSQNQYINAQITRSNNTIVARDNSGNIYANVFDGTATTARYADLAEVYTTDQEYPVGTIMAVGGDEETRAAKVSDLAIGVISENPAYLMNRDCDGQAIALKGRVPVRVQGPVSKGQAVYSWQDGVGSTIASNGLVGVALETNNEEGEKLVECVLKV